jgi:hypothetical protein
VHHSKDFEGAMTLAEALAGADTEQDSTKD